MVIIVPITIAIPIGINTSPEHKNFSKEKPASFWYAFLKSLVSYKNNKPIIIANIGMLANKNQNDCIRAYWRASALVKGQCCENSSLRRYNSSFLSSDFIEYYSKLYHKCGGAGNKNRDQTDRYLTCITYYFAF